jgi:hypothetical protein
MSDEIEELKDRILDIVKSRTGDFLDQNQAAKDLLVERSKRLAKLMIKMGRADEADVPTIKADIAYVRQTMENEMSRLAIDASQEARSMFMSVVGTVFETAQKMLPTLLALL